MATKTPARSSAERIDTPKETGELRDTWDAVWRRKRSRGMLAGLWRRGGGRDAIHREVRRIVEQELRPRAGQTILEAGSGSGLISLRMARRGVNAVLVDLSPEGLALARESAAGEPALIRRVSLIGARVETLPVADASVDAVWSAGVLEHLPEEDRLRALREFFRITRPGGVVLVIHPWAGAPIYRAAKSYADRRGLWQAGGEEPIDTMLHLFSAIPDARSTREYSTGFLVQFHFLKYRFAAIRPLYLGWVLLVELLHVPFAWLNRRPGYNLVTVARKSAHSGGG